MSTLFECCSFLADAELRQNVVRRNQVKAMVTEKSLRSETAPHSQIQH